MEYTRKVSGSPKLIQFILKRTGTSVDNFTYRWIIIHFFHIKPQMWTSWWFLRSHPLGTVGICTEFHGNLSSICWDISVWTKVINRWPSLEQRNRSERSDGHMVFIFSELSVLSGGCINTNKCMRRSSQAHVQKENVMQNTEEKPQISQTSA